MLRNKSAWFVRRRTSFSAAQDRRRHHIGVEALDGRVLLSASPSLGLGLGSGVPAVPTLVGSLGAGGTSAPDGSTSPVGFTPAQIRHAYGFDQLFANSLDGTGQTIAIVDAFNDPNIAGDLKAFDSQFQLPAPPSFRVVAQDGSNNLPKTDPTGAGKLNWESEEALDVEWAHAMAPGASILEVEANDTSTSNLLAAAVFASRQPGVSVVSMSFGSTTGESSSDSSNNADFLTPAGHPGVTFVASSGDSGVPLYPSTSPNVLAVGGTNLFLDAHNNISSETAWSGSGGGISQFEFQPAYQKGVVTQSTTKRTSPDVAYNAGNGVAIYDSYNNGTSSPWTAATGTSAGAPQWSALIAIADQGRSRAGLPTLDGASQTLPLLYHLPSSAFHDITSGSNVGFSAGTGYDLVTGRGSPVAPQVVSGLGRPFTVAGSGSLLYQLDSTGNLWQYNSSGWQVLASGVTSFALGKPGTPWANGIFALKADGELMETVGNGWFDIGTNVTSFALGNPGTLTGNWLFALKSDGELMETDGYGFSDIGTNVTSFAVGNPGTSTGNWLFALKSDGELMETDGYGFSDIGTNVTSFAVGNPGTSTGNWLFALKSDGELMETDGYGFSDIGTNVTSFAVGNPGTSTGNWLFALKSDGELMETDGFGFSDIGTNVTSFALGNPSTPWAGDVFALESDGELMESFGNGFFDIGTNVTSFALGYGGTTWANGIIAIESDGELIENVGNGFFDIGYTTTSFQLGYDGTPWYGGIFALKTDGELMESLNNGFFDIGYTTTSFQLGYDGTPWYGGVFALKTDGELMETLGNGFFDIGYTTTSFQLGYDGTPWANGIFALKSDGELMETLGNGFFDIGYTVTSFALGHAGTAWANDIIALKSDGELMTTVGNGFSDLDTGVKSFLVGSGGFLDVLESNGNLWQYASASSRAQLDQSVQSISLSSAGFIVNAVETTGKVRQFGT